MFLNINIIWKQIFTVFLFCFVFILFLFLFCFCFYFVLCYYIFLLLVCLFCFIFFGTNQIFTSQIGDAAYGEYQRVVAPRAILLAVVVGEMMQGTFLTTNLPK